MEAIKKKIAALKMEMDGANEAVEMNESKVRQENLRADLLFEEVRDFSKKLITIAHDYEVAKATLESQSAALEACEKSFAKAEQDRTVLTKRVQDIEESLTKKEELRELAQLKLEKCTELLDESKRMSNVLEERARIDEERIKNLTEEVKAARQIAEESDTKSEEIASKHQLLEEEMENAEERVKSNEAKIIEREDELFIVQNIYKSLAVSEKKSVNRVEQSKTLVKELKAQLKAAEKRAILAEKEVKVLQADIDKKEDELREEKEKYYEISHDMDLTFAEMSGF